MTAPALNSSARDIMAHPVWTIRETATLREAEEMLACRRISGAPVVDESGNIAGVISESDLLEEAERRIGKRRPIWAHVSEEEASALSQRPGERLEDMAALPVRELMSRYVVAAEEDASVEELGRLMEANRVNRIPIVRDGRPVGIVTRADVLRALFGLPESVGDRPDEPISKGRHDSAAAGETEGAQVAARPSRPAPGEKEKR